MSVRFSLLGPVLGLSWGAGALRSFAAHLGLWSAPARVLPTVNRLPETLRKYFDRQTAKSRHATKTTERASPNLVSCEPTWGFGPHYMLSFWSVYGTPRPFGQFVVRTGEILDRSAMSHGTLRRQSACPLSPGPLLDIILDPSSSPRSYSSLSSSSASSSSSSSTSVPSASRSCTPVETIQHSKRMSTNHPEDFAEDSFSHPGLLLTPGPFFYDPGARKRPR